MTPQQKQHEENILKQVPYSLSKAERLRQKGELDEALRVMVPYLNDHFDDVPALMLTAHILMDAERIGLVHPLLKRAAQLEPNIAMIWNNLGLCYQEGADLEEGETHFFRALKLEPNDAVTHLNLGQLYNNLSQPHLAIKHCNKAIENDPGLPEAYYNRALANVALGNYREGWADYDATLGQGKTRKERVYGLIPRWNGEEGKTIIAYGEQGMGDEISFASCIPDLVKKNKVIIECNPRLWGLFKRSFNLETHGTRFNDMIPWLHDQKTGQQRKIDGAVAFGSLPQYYRNETREFPGTPYLIADHERRLQWKALLDSLGPKMKVGIAWTGGNKNTGKARRSVDLEDMLPILRQDATFISLQYMDSPEVDVLKKNHGIEVHHWPRAVQSQDHDDCAALIAELDLVITVQTAVVHLSGALGKTCWAMLPRTPRWFYGISGNTMPWYNSVKLYRQKYKWVDLISEVASDLRNLIQPPIASKW